MKLVNRYILNEMLKLFVGVLVVVSVAFVTQRLIFLTEWSMHRGVGMLGILKLLACLFPSLFLLAIPLTTLVVIIIILSHLSEENELVVMMSCGRSLVQLAQPVLVFSLITMIFTAYLALFLAPESERWFEIVRWRLLQNKSETALPTQTFVEFSRDSQIYIQSKDEEGLKNLIIFQKGQSNWPFGAGADSVNFIFTRRARIQNQPGEAVSTLLLENGSFISHQSSPELDQFVKFDKTVARVDFEGVESLQKRLKRQVKAADIERLIDIIDTPIDELLRDKDNIKHGITLAEDARVELSQRVSQILACLLLALWGIGLGIKPPRTSRTISMVLGAVSGFGFYYLNVLFKALALKKLMPLELAIFSPLILVCLSGAWLVEQRLKGKEPLNFLYQLDERIRQLRAEKKNK